MTALPDEVRQAATTAARARRLRVNAVLDLVADLVDEGHLFVAPAPLLSPDAAARVGLSRAAAADRLPEPPAPDPTP